MTMSGLRQEAAENTQNKFKDVFTTTTTPPLPATTTLTHCKVIYLSPPKKAKTKKPNLFATFNCALKLYSSHNIFNFYFTSWGFVSDNDLTGNSHNTFRLFNSK